MNFTEDRMIMATCSKDARLIFPAVSSFGLSPFISRKDATAKLWTMDDYECIKESALLQCNQIEAPLPG